MSEYIIATKLPTHDDDCDVYANVGKTMFGMVPLRKINNLKIKTYNQDKNSLVFTVNLAFNYWHYISDLPFSVYLSFERLPNQIIITNNGAQN